MEIVLLLGFADAIFRRERSDDRKCVCASQANISAEQVRSDTTQVSLQMLTFLGVKTHAFASSTQVGWEGIQPIGKRRKKRGWP